MSFVIDELMMEGHRDTGGDARRIHDLQTMLWEHVNDGTPMDEHVPSLLAAYDDLVAPAQNAVAGALCELCLRTRDLDLARTLGEREEHRAFVMKRVRQANSPSSPEWSELFLAWAADGGLAVREALCLCVGRMAGWGADVDAFVPWLFEALSTKGEGRGHARIDVGRQAAVALARVAIQTGDSTIDERLRARAKERNPTATNVTTALEIIGRER